MTSLSATTSHCRGGASYDKRKFVIRVASRYANTETAPTIKNADDTEAALYKLGSSWDLERISIHTSDGSTYNSLRNYLLAQGVKIMCHPITYVEVCIDTYWQSWEEFSSNSTLADGAPIIMVPQGMEYPVVLPRGGVAYALATYKFRHTERKSPSDPNEFYEAKLVVSSPDCERVIELNDGEGTMSLNQWTYDWEPKHEELGSPWSYIDVKVGDNWVSGITFRSLRCDSTPDDDIPVPRQNADTPLDVDDDDEIDGETIVVSQIAFPFTA